MAKGQDLLKRMQRTPFYYIARHPEFGDIAGPVGTGASPEEALAELREARRSLITVLLERGDSIPEPRPVKTAAA